MSGESLSTLILFIGGVLIATSVMVSMVGTVSDLNQSFDGVGDRLGDQLERDIAIISDATSSATYDSGTNTLTILVKNTGTTELPITTLDVLVDGEYVTPDSTSIVSSGTDWSENEVLELTFNIALSSGEHTVKVSLRGTEDTFVFII
jgi:flagellar protein FlaG